MMEYALYIAAIAALISGFVLYRRRKVRKQPDQSYRFSAVPPGGDPVDDVMHFFCRKRDG